MCIHRNIRQGASDFNYVFILISKFIFFGFTYTFLKKQDEEFLSFILSFKVG